MIRTSKGFTIVELLIVIVVISVLASISVAAFNGTQQRAKVSRANNDLTTLNKAIQLARINTGKRLIDITGSGCSTCGGYTAMNIAIDNIATASGMNIAYLKNNDPWGNIFVIDENEGEGGSPCANRDGIALSVKQTGVPDVFVPFYSCPN